VGDEEEDGEDEDGRKMKPWVRRSPITHDVSRHRGLH
jgi:hypothetical protein